MSRPIYILQASLLQSPPSQLTPCMRVSYLARSNPGACHYINIAVSHPASPDACPTRSLPFHHQALPRVYPFTSQYQGLLNDKGPESSSIGPISIEGNSSGSGSIVVDTAVAVVAAVVVEVIVMAGSIDAPSCAAAATGAATSWSSFVSMSGSPATMSGSSSCGGSADENRFHSGSSAFAASVADSPAARLVSSASLCDAVSSEGGSFAAPPVRLAGSPVASAVAALRTAAAPMVPP